MTRNPGGLQGILLAAWLSGCALTSKGEVLSPRYFSPTLEAPTAPSAASTPLELRLGRIEPAAHLEERIAYRVSATELAYYEDRRWTEPPEQFVRRALESELFERRAFRRVVSGVAPTLDVELLSFEEMRVGAPRARLSVLITLRDDRRALLERTISVDAPLGAGSDPGPALAEAMAAALGDATRRVAEQVGSALERQALAVRQDAPEPRAHQD
jgi:cholesterol transport system auxiliary component